MTAATAICFIAVFTMGLIIVNYNPTYAILGLPDFNSNTNNNANDNSSTSAPEPTQQQTTANGSSTTTTYKNSAFGFTIEHPSDWEVHEFDVTPLMVNENTKSPALAVYDTVSFLLKNKNVTDTGAYTDTMAQASFSISPLNLAKYLDVNDLKVKNKTAHDYVIDSVNYMTSYDPSKLLQYKVIRDKPTTIGGGTNHYPAWGLDYTNTALGSTKYNIDIFSVIGDKVFKFSTSADPLKIPDYLPIFQKMLDSFQIIK